MTTDSAKTPFKYKLLIIFLVIILSTLIFFRHNLISFLTSTIESQNKTSKMVEVYYHGGMCPDGECGSTITIMSDGSVERSMGIKYQIDKDELSKLKNIIKATNFDDIKSKKFTDTCPTAYDGSEVIYTINIGKISEKFSSCEYQLDPNNELFKEIEYIFRMVHI